MADLKSARLIWIKGVLFLLLGLLSSGLLLLRTWDVMVALLLVVSIWAFCRFYYFAFYVLEHYVDSRFKFSGLFSFVRYALRTCRGKQDADDMEHCPSEE